MEKGKKRQELNKTKQPTTNKKPTTLFAPKWRKYLKERNKNLCNSLLWLDELYLAASKESFIFSFCCIEANVTVVCAGSTQCSWGVVEGLYCPAIGQKKKKWWSSLVLLGFPVAQQSQKESSVPALCTYIAGSFWFSILSVSLWLKSNITTAVCAASRPQTMHVNVKARLIPLLAHWL